MTAKPMETMRMDLGQTFVRCSSSKETFSHLSTAHSALKLEKSANSKVQKYIICIFKNGKKSIFAPEKSLKLLKMQF